MTQAGWHAGHIPLSCSTLLAAREPVAAALATIEKLGFGAADVVLIEDWTEFGPAQVRTPAGRARLIGTVAESGLEVADFMALTGFDYGILALNHPDPAEREASRALFTDMLDLAVALGASTFTVVPGTDWPGEDHAVSMARSSEELAWRLDRARDAGVRLSTEPHAESLINQPEAALSLLESVPGLGVTLDWSQFLQLGTPPGRSAPLLPHVAHVHMRGARPGRNQVPMSENTLDFSALARDLEALGYEGYMASEYVWVPPGHELHVDVVAEVEKLVQSLVVE